MEKQPANTSGAAPLEKLAEYDAYKKAQATVDALSDAGFPVRNVTIVWSRLRKIEYVTGRRSWLTAARDGAISGLWFGGFIGLLISLFVELEEGTSAVAVVITYALVGAAIGAIFVAFQHASLRGQRDFTTSGRIDAEAYEVWVSASEIDAARRVLASTPQQ